MITVRPIAKIGIIPTNIKEIVWLTENDMINENANINGHLTAILIIIIYAIWTLVTSVVSLVTILEVENLSMFEKENFCTL